MNVSERVGATRRERDAIVALVAVLFVPFGAGFIAGFSGASGATLPHYEATVLVVFYTALVYILYRGVRRGVGRVRRGGG